MRFRTVAVVGLLTAAVLSAVGGALAYRNAQERRFQDDLASARAELVANRHFSALERLQELAKRRPESGEVQYLLGINAAARGRTDQAEAAWARVRPGDAPHFGYAALHQAEIDQGRGKLAVAEDRLRAGLADPGSHRPRVRWALAQLLVLEGRRAEAARLLAEGLPEHPEPLFALKDLYRLEHDPFPMEEARRLLETSARIAPDDPRVTLGRAHLALRERRFSEAETFLNACLKSRPDDRPAWELAVELGLEADRPDLIARALPHLPTTPALLSKAAEIRAWAARRAGDRAAEHKALTSWRDQDPTNPTPWERLAALAIEEGHPDEAASLRRERSERRKALETYLNQLGLYDGKTPPATMEKAARDVGRLDDADYWASQAGKPRSPAPAPASPGSLAEAQPDLAAQLAKLAPTPASESNTASAAATPRFEEAAETSGLRFEHRTGASSGRPIPPVTMGGGVATFDYDGDGWLDVYLVQSGEFPPPSGPIPQGDRLFRNKGDGTFEDATERSGLSGFPGGYGHGVTIGDVDNDGHPDIFVTRWRAYALYRNRGDGTFEDATKSWGLDGDRDWPTSAAFADLDDDGDLDLYVCHYFRWDENDPRSCLDPSDPSKYACGPRQFAALPDHLFRNDGGRFADVSEAAGIKAVDTEGRGLGVLAGDLDDDGRVDLYVANDLTANFLWKNLGGLKFAERGLEAGVAGDESGGYQAGMGLASGDLDDDGRPDLLVTNFYGESSTLFRNLGGGLFADQSGPTGVRSATRYLLGFGTAFLDADNDARLDLLTVNGHVHDGRPRFPWRMPAQLLWGRPGPRFEDISPRAGDVFGVERLGRGLAVGDLNNDGRMDAVLLSEDEPVAVFRNATESSGGSVTLHLEGTRSNRDAVGATVRATLAGGRVLTAFRHGGGSYQSASDPRVHLGLGDARRVESLEVRWPSGAREQFGPVEPGRGYRLREGAGAPAPLRGWGTR